MENFSFKNVSFTYPEQENKALHGISFEVNQGEFLILSALQVAENPHCFVTLKPVLHLTVY